MRSQSTSGEEFEEVPNKPEMQREQVVKAGDFITYKKLFSGETYDNTVQPDKYLLHREFLGKRVGDVVRFVGKDYEITAIL